MFSGVIVDLAGVQKDLIHHGCCRERPRSWKLEAHVGG